MSSFFKKTGIFLQARLNSTRMPGKEMVELCGKTLLQQAMERLNVIPADVKAVLTTEFSEYAFKPIAAKLGWDIFIGDSQNVLKRFVDAAIFYKIDIIIRATADNPLLSSEIALKTIELFNNDNSDLAYLKPVPLGSGVEVVSTKALIKALEETKTPYDMEHVTPYIYKHKDKYKISCGTFYDDDKVAREDIKISIDKREDFERINHLFKNLQYKKTNYKIKNVIEAYDNLNFSKIKNMLFIFAFSNEFGIGHLKRVECLSEKFKNEFNIFLCAKHGNINNTKQLNDPDFKRIEYNCLKDYVRENGIFDRVIADLRDTSVEEMEFIKQLGKVFSFDDLGEGGKISEVNIRSLPSLKEYKNYQFNFDGLEYLFTQVKKVNSHALKNPPKDVLITFGGSDPDNLSFNTAKILKEQGFNIKIIIGPYFKVNLKELKENLPGVEIIKDQDDISQLIINSDLVITSFGMTFLESLIQNKPVLLINPSNYHDKLAEDFGYPYLLKRNSEKGLNVEINALLGEIIKRMIKDGAFTKDSPLKKFYSLNIGTKVNDIVSVINNYNYSQPICPYCCKVNSNTIYRTTKWSMIKCKNCSLIYLSPHENKELEYEKDYFVDEYKKSYGKTYEEDKPNIAELAKSRLEIIKTYVTKGNLLDFGCGLGFFSEQCEKQGFKTTSVDISKYAVNYIIKELNLKGINAGIEFLENSDEQFDAITSFYFIEHLKDFEKIIFLFKCHLKHNGVLALSTPNSKGISVKKNFEAYKVQHPDDHYRFFSPKFMKNLLRRFGFNKIKIVIKGIHADRFLKSKKLLGNKTILKLINLYGNFFQLGDTFEIYAQKK